MNNNWHQKGYMPDWSTWLWKEHGFKIASWSPNYAEVVFKAEYFLLFDKEVFI